jgi:hypothetical protein
MIEKRGQAIYWADGSKWEGDFDVDCDPNRGVYNAPK